MTLIATVAVVCDVTAGSNVGTQVGTSVSDEGTFCFSTLQEEYLYP
jgi:hypothetical protein